MLNTCLQRHWCGSCKTQLLRMELAESTPTNGIYITQFEKI
jgi:hypothetical protein